MSFPKGQSDIIAIVLIVVIAIGLISVAFTFGLPLIQKNQDRAIEERVKVFFDPTNSNSLPSKIKAVSNSGGKDAAVLDVEGVMALGVANNSINFTFQSTVASHAVNRTVSLTGDSCPPAEGLIGLDDPAVVCVTTELGGGGFYTITYTLYMRELEDSQKKNGFKINLLKHPSSVDYTSGSSPSVRVEFGERRPEVVGSKNLINTDVKILLV